MAKDITLKDKNGGIKYPKTVTAIVYENGTGKTLQTIIDEMRQVDSDTNTRTQHFKADVNTLDSLNNKTDIGLYNYVGTGWRGSVSVCYDSADNVSQVALSSSTPSYNGNTLTWLSAQPCAMARTYTNGAWSHWEKVGAPVVNDLTTGGTDKALSAEMGKTLKEGLDALGPKLGQTLSINIAEYPMYNTIVNASGVWEVPHSGVRTSIIPIPQGTTKLSIKTTYTYNSNYAFLVSDSHVTGENVSFASGCQRVLIEKDVTYDADVPQDAKYLAVRNDNVSSTFTISFTIDRFVKIERELLGIADINAEVNTLHYKLGYRKYDKNDVTSGSYYHLTGVSVDGTYNGTTALSESWGAYDRISLSKGEKIVIATLGGSNARAYCITDASNNKVLALASANTDLISSPFSYTADRSVYIYVNDKSPYDGNVAIDRDYISKIPTIENELEDITNNLEDIANDLEGAESDIQTTKEAILDATNYKNTDVTSGYYYSLGSISVGGTYNGNAYADSGWGILPVFNAAKGSTISISTKGGNSARAWCITTTSGVVLVIAAASTDTTQTPYVYEATQDVKVYVNCKTSDLSAFNVEISSSKIANIQQEVEALKNSFVTSKLSNPTIDICNAQHVKVLDIGNSFTADALEYLPDLISAANISMTDMSVYILARGGGSFKTFIDSWNNNDVTDGGEPSCHYSLYRAAGAEISISGGSVLQRMHEAIKTLKWDIIMIHQVSTYSGTPSVWEGDSDGGHLNEFLRIIRAYQPQAMIGYLWGHASYGQSTGGNTEQLWRDTKKGIEFMQTKYGISFVVPVATAIENLRKSSLNASPIARGFSRDGHHLGYGLARYVAAATYFQALVGARYGISVYGNTAVHEVTSAESADATYSDECVDVTNSNKGVAQMCAVLACADMFTAIDPDGIDIDG